MVKIGEKVRCLVTECDVTEGSIYEVIKLSSGGVYLYDDRGDEYYLMAHEFETLPVEHVYIINGASKEYPTLEAAEAGVKAIGNHGVTYEIAQIVKRVTVKRETVVTLEETV